MKKIALLATTLCLLLVLFAGCENGNSCDGCVGCFGLYEELDCELVQRLRTDYRNQILGEIGWSSADELPLEDIRVLSHLGTFGGNKALSMFSPLPRTQVDIYVEIAGYTFRFVGNDSGLYVYDAPRFVTLSMAYGEGLVSGKDISKIWQSIDWRR